LWFAQAEACAKGIGILVSFLVAIVASPSSPRFFVSVASKELSIPINPLESTLMGGIASVDVKGLGG
jgi:hypothetical protein